MRKVYLPVTGMSCAACAWRVEKAFSGTEGVYGAIVNFAADKAAVEYHPASADPDSLIRAVEEAGYGVEKSKTDFGVTGMSRAACVGRVEKALLRVPGVLDASVNLAAERATVERVAGTSGVADLKRAVEGAGYGVVRVGEEEPAEDARGREYRRLRRTFLIAAELTALILAGSVPMMFGFTPPVPVRWLNLVLLALATLVQVWAGWRFYRGAWGAPGTGRPT